MRALSRALIVTLLVSVPVFAQEQKPADQKFTPLVDVPQLRNPIKWEGRRFSTLDWVVSGTAAGIALASNIFPPGNNHWTGTNSFDESFRNVFRLSSPYARYTARDVSDVLLSVEVTWPFFVDALIGTWWYHDSPDAAAQIAFIDIEAYTIVTALQGSSTLFASRERPYGRDCGADFLPSTTADCSSRNSRYRAFFSGHSSTSFLAATLTCVHHLKLGIFGDKTADIATCVVAYSGATATALLRTMGDVHYGTDVIFGAIVGTTIGLVIPLIHYKTPHDDLQVMVMPFGAGLGIGGIF